MASVIDKIEFEEKISNMESEINEFEKALRTSFIDVPNHERYNVIHKITTQCNTLKREVYNLIELKSFDPVINVKVNNIYSRAILYILRYEQLLDKDIPLSGDLLSIDTNYWLRKRNLMK